MSPRIFPGLTYTFTALLCLSLAACNVGQGVKTLGKKAGVSSGTASSDADAFAITSAYRDPATDAATPVRTISMQGIRGVPSASLVNECGATGSQCTCEFYLTATDASPKLAASVGISSQNNSFSCVIPASITNAQIQASTAPGSSMYVKLKRIDAVAKNTSLIAIKSTLTLEDILGSNLSRTKVRGIFRYSCNRTFFEGEGVTASNITCLAGQHLGVLGVTYNFYIYRSGEDRNDQGSDSAFPDNNVCGRNSHLKIQCTGNTPELRYGFYKDAIEPFVVGISMTRAPEGENLSATYGYAALPDSAGNCPTGLVKVRPWVAQPASIIQNSLGDNPPSSFINTNNSLNNTVVEQNQPTPNFIVTRQRNLTPCDAVTGSCLAAAFAGIEQAQSVAYTALTPVVCAIPPNLLSGLF